MRILTIAAIATLAVAAAAVAAVSRQPTAGGANRALSLVTVEQQCGGADLPPVDGSPGDIAMCHGRLHQPASGADVGSAAWFCPYIGTEQAGSLCTAVASLRDGDIELAGRLSHLSPRSTWAITGGTGSYAGVSGTAALRQIDDTHTAVTITFIR
jgi:opacity protein-like surface antigen